MSVDMRQEIANAFREAADWLEKLDWDKDALLPDPDEWPDGSRSSLESIDWLRDWARRIEEQSQHLSATPRMDEVAMEPIQEQPYYPLVHWARRNGRTHRQEGH